MFDAIETAIYSDIDGLNGALFTIDVDRLAPEFMIGIPRALFPLRDRLTQWLPYVVRAWFSLSRNKECDVRELLQGLL